MQHQAHEAPHAARLTQVAAKLDQQGEPRQAGQQAPLKRPCCELQPGQQLATQWCCKATRGNCRAAAGRTTWPA